MGRFEVRIRVLESWVKTLGGLAALPPWVVAAVSLSSPLLPEPQPRLPGRRQVLLQGRADLVPADRASFVAPGAA